MIFVTFGAPSWPKLKKCVKKVPFWLSQAKITENDQPLRQLFRHPGAKNHTFRIFPALLSIFIVMENCEKSFFCSRWPVEVVLCWSFLVILAWDNQKGTFLTHFFNFGHEGAPNVTKLTYNMKILWENSHRKKNWGSFVHRGLRYEFLRKKIWTVPLILQFNIYRSLVGLNHQQCTMGKLKNVVKSSQH